MNMGRVSIGYQCMSVMVDANGISAPPLPHSSSANTVATKPMAPNTLCPVTSMSIIIENISRAIISWLMRCPSQGTWRGP
jgi:hypothetical protein